MLIKRKIVWKFFEDENIKDANGDPAMVRSITSHTDIPLGRGGKIEPMLIFELLSEHGLAVDYSGKEINKTFENPNIKLLINGTWRSLSRLDVKYSLREVKTYLNFLLPKEYRGLKDYATKRFKTSYLNLHELFPILSSNDWTEIKSADEIPENPNTLILEIQHFQFPDGEMFDIVGID